MRENEGKEIGLYITLAFMILTAFDMESEISRVILSLSRRLLARFLHQDENALQQKIVSVGLRYMETYS